MKSLTHSPSAWWILGIASLLLFSAGIGNTPIYILDEAKNAEAAREMLSSGDWLVPHFNGELRTDKPPFHYYFMALMYALFGASAWTARIFSAVMGTLTVLFTYRITSEYLGRAAGWWTAIALLASLHFSFEFHLAVPDPYLICCTTLALLFFYKGYTDKSQRWLFAMYGCIGLGALAKGPVAIALPGLIFLLYILYRRDLRWKSLMALRPFRGALLVLAIALPWYLAVHFQTDGAWTRGFFIDHNLDRFSDTKEGHGGIFLYTPLVALLGMMPFSFFIVQALGRAWRDRQKSLLAFALIAAGTIIGFFSLSSTKLPNYAMPSYPFLAILLGYFTSQMPHMQLKKTGVWASLALLFLVSMALPIAAYIGIGQDKEVGDLAWVAYSLAPLPVGAAFALFFYFRRKTDRMAYTLSLSFVLTGLLVFTHAYPRLYSRNPVSEALPQMNTERPLLYYKLGNPAFVFNTQRIIPRASRESELRELLRQYPDAYIITRKRYLSELQPLGPWRTVSESRDTFERPITLVLERE